MSKKNKNMKSGKKKSNYNKKIKKETINQEENINKEKNEKKTIENSNKEIKKENNIKKKEKTKKDTNNKIKKDNKEKSIKVKKNILKNVISKMDNLKDKTKKITKKYLDQIKNKYDKNKDIKKSKNKKATDEKNKIKVRKNKDKEIKKNQKEPIKLDYNAMSIEQIETELKKEKYKSKYFNILSSTIYGLIIVAALAAIIATLIMPVFQISGKSMAPELDNGDLVISIKTKKLNSGDIIAFYHGNKILVKRVIASAGEWVAIDKDGKVYIDGKLLEEPYIDESVLGDCDIKFPYQVPAESWFVLGDNRTIFTDSRNSEIGSIKNEDIIGKILFKLWDANK